MCLPLPYDNFGHYDMTLSVAAPREDRAVFVVPVFLDRSNGKSTLGFDSMIWRV